MSLRFSLTGRCINIAFINDRGIPESKQTTGRKNNSPETRIRLTVESFSASCRPLCPNTIRPGPSYSKNCPLAAVMLSSRKLAKTSTVGISLHQGTRGPIDQWRKLLKEMHVNPTNAQRITSGYDTNFEGDNGQMPYEYCNCFALGQMVETGDVLGPFRVFSFLPSALQEWS